MRARLIWFAVFAVLALAAASPGVWLGDDDPPSNAVPKAEFFFTDGPHLAASGEFVRGTLLDLTLSGLSRIAGHEIDVAVEGDGGSALGIATAQVDDDGTVTTRVAVPNALSAEGDHTLRITSRTAPTDPGYRLTFSVSAAERDVDYDGLATDATSCGGPPVAIAFDGRNWVPEDLSVFPPGVERYEGTITLLAAERAEFTSAGRTATLVPGGAYSC